MSLKNGWGASALLLACCAAAAWVGPASAQDAESPAGGCATGNCATGNCATGNCGSWWSCCCPKYCFTIEKPPKIKFKTVCSKPVCEPCEIEGYGYYPTCWRPFAYPPDYAHCPVPPPGALASQAPPLFATPVPAAPGGGADETLPEPMRTANPHPNR